MGIESCIGKSEISEKHGNRVDVGTMSGNREKFEEWVK